MTSPEVAIAVSIKTNWYVNYCGLAKICPVSAFFCAKLFIQTMFSRCTPNSTTTRRTDGVYLRLPRRREELTTVVPGTLGVSGTALQFRFKSLYRAHSVFHLPSWGFMRAFWVGRASPFVRDPFVGLRKGSCSPGVPSCCGSRPARLLLIRVRNVELGVKV